MSYRLYLAQIPTRNTETQFHLEQSCIHTLSKSPDYENGIIPNYAILEKMKLSHRIELGKNPVAAKLLTQCQPYFTKEIRENNPWLTSDPTDPTFVGVVTKDMLLQFIRDIHQYQIDEYKAQYQEAQNNAEISAKKFIQNTADAIVRWETSQHSIKIDKHDLLVMPHIVTRRRLFNRNTYKTYNQHDQR